MYDMDTLTIEINNPKVRALIDNLISPEPVKVAPTPAPWHDRWQTLQASIPDTDDELSEEDLFAKIRAVGEVRSGCQ